MNIGVVREFREHKVSHIGPQYFCLDGCIGGAESAAVDTDSETIGEHRGSDDEHATRIEGVVNLS